jgi:hypothetical protein
VDTLEIVIVVMVVLTSLLAVLGYIGVQRRRRATAGQFGRDLEQVNRDLAAAHAADNGWDPATVEGAARRAFAERHAGVEPTAVYLMQVIDKPGTDDDKAIFRIEAESGAHDVTLGRQAGQWVPETVD